jgi:DNA-binding CsgD family transcriptional regulator
MFATGTATAARYQDSLEAALMELAVAEEFDFEFVRRYGLLARARALIGLRDLTPADKALRDVERRLRKSPDAFLDTSCAIEWARLYLTLGDHQRAYAALAPDLPRRMSRGPRGEYLALRALVLAASGGGADAVVTASRARSISCSVPTQCLCLLATHIAEAPTASSPARTRTVFEQAVRLGGVDALILACRASQPLAEQLAGDQEVRSELIRLFVESHDHALARKVGARAPRSMRRAAELSPREAEIHQLIAQGLTNPEISRLLFISPSTTKVHVRHILEKLGVRSRVEAARIWEPDAS